ncbi:MAG: hypothetical protein ACREQI_05215 [Candidatus Binataceae bacterium]
MAKIESIKRRQDGGGDMCERARIKLAQIPGLLTSVADRLALAASRYRAFSRELAFIEILALENSGSAMNRERRDAVRDERQAALGELKAAIAQTGDLCTDDTIGILGNLADADGGQTDVPWKIGAIVIGELSACVRVADAPVRDDDAADRILAHLAIAGARAREICSVIGIRPTE